MASAQLASLISDPERIDDLSPEGIPALLGELKEVEARLWVRLQASTAPTPEPAKRNEGPDRLLDAAETAKRLDVSRRWVYRHAGTLPFRKKLSNGTLRFSEQGITKWLARR